MKLLLLGDVSPAPVSSPYFINGDVEILFSDVTTLFENKDVNFVNLECALTDSDNAIKKFGPPLKAPIEVADVLSKIGVTVCGLSNNHIFDYGKAGLNDTINSLEHAGIDYTGFGDNYDESRKNYIVEKDGEKISVITVCEHEFSYALNDRMGARPYDEYDTIEDIRNAKKESDRVIVIYHGGKEQCRYPSPRLHQLCHAMAKAGADVVLCQHSHCVGCYEEFNGCHILYGQGNFFFVGPEFAQNVEGWNDGVAVSYDTHTHHIEFVHYVANDKGIELAKGEEKTSLENDFEERNKKLADGSWLDKWHEFCIGKRAIYQRVVKKEFRKSKQDRMNNLFGHYIDCEAHLDVLKELYKTYNETNER